MPSYTDGAFEIHGTYITGLIWSRHQPPSFHVNGLGNEQMKFTNYLAQQYQLYLEKQPYSDWREAYEDICVTTRELANALKGTNRDSFEAACHAKTKIRTFISGS